MGKSLRSGMVLFVAMLAAGVMLAQQPEVVHTDDFQSYGTQKNPPGWVDTSVGSSRPEANGLYKTWPDPLQGNQGSNVVFGTKQSSGKPEGNNPRIGTFSTLTTKTFNAAGRFEYRGRFIRTNADTRIGLTFFSSYPEIDSYYLIGLWSSPNSAALTMQLFAFGGGAPAGVLDSALSPEANRWYRFLIQVDDVDNATKIRARFWLDGMPEPETFSIDATDAGASRLKQGRIGLWSAVKGDAYVDDLFAKSPVDHLGPVLRFIEADVVLAAGSVTPLNHDARVGVTATDDLSGVASLTVTVGGAPYTPLTPIAVEGLHTIAAVAVDGAGNRTAEQVQVVVDKTAPVIVAGGVTDGLLVNRAVVPTFRVEDRTSVTVDAKLNGMPFASGTTVEAEGVYTLVIQATDAVGWTSSVTIRFEIDRTPPVIALTAPAPGERVVTPSITVRGTVTGATGVTVNGAAATIESGAFAAPATLLEGPNSITAVAVDAAGNRAPASVDVTLDTRAPELAIAAPSREACLNVTELQVRGSAIDAALAKVIVSAGSQRIEATIAEDKRTFTATLAALPEGKLTIRIEATDASGHATVSTIPVTIDRTKPQLALHDGGAAFTVTATNRTVAPRVVVTDLDAAPQLTVTLDGVPFVSGTAIEAEKTYELRATATDCAGNVSDELVHRFTIDRTAPAVAFTNPANGATVRAAQAISGTLSEPATVAVEGRGEATVNGLAFTIDGLLADGANALLFIATDPAGNASRTPYNVTVDGVAPSVEITESGAPIAANALFTRPVTPVITSNDPSATITATLGGAPFASGTTIAADGSYAIEAKARDLLGNESTATASFRIDRTPPSIDITSPADGAVVGGASVVVTGTASGARSVAVNTIAATIANGTFTAMIPLELGSNRITAIATDDAGNTASDAIEVERDPGKLALLLTAPPDQLLTNRPTIAVAGQVISPANAQKVTINGVEVPFDPAGAFRRLDFPLAEGANEITAAVTSRSGQASSVKVTVRADFTPPQLVVMANGTALADGARFATAPALALQTNDEGAVTKLMIDGELVAPGVTPLADGGHTLTATARDAAGNETRLDRVFFVGAAGSIGGGCALRGFDPIQNAAVFSETVRITGRSGGAAGVLVNNNAAAVADGSFCGDATLAPGRNEIAIRCTDASGQPTSDAPVTLVLHRYVDPQVTIAAPADLSTATQNKVTVSGTVGAGVTSGDVNGIAFTVPDDGAASHTFSVPDVPLTSGLNAIIVRARTRSSRMATASTRVTLLNAAPQIAITSPLASSETGSASIDVSGTYANVDPSTIAVAIGGAQFAVAATPLSETTGTFRAATVALAPNATSTIRVTGRNAAGAQTAASVDVRQVATAPRIAITAPADNTFLPSSHSGPLTVSGTYAGDPGSTVQVGGATATLANGAFTAQVELTGGASGVTPIVARITTPDSRSATDAIRVTRFSAPLALRDSFPAADAAGVDPGSTIVALFSNPLDGSTANALRVTDASGTAVDGKLFVDRDSIAFVPAQPLRGGRYTVTIAATLKDASGATLAAPQLFSFTAGGSAPLTAPVLDETATTGCFAGATLTGRVVTPNARVRLDVDGVTMTATANESGAFRFTFTFSGQPGYHVVRVREIGADGTLSAERALCYRITCTTLQVASATLDREAKTIAIQFSKPMEASTLVVGSSILITAEGEALAGTLSMNAASDMATIALASVPQKTIALTVKKSVRDASGNALSADYTQTFVYSSDPQLGRGDGYVNGAVYDATTGRPLESAVITFLNPSFTISNPPRGRYARSMPEGAYTIEASSAGYTTVWRQIVVPAGAGVVPIDIRLTRRGEERTANGSPQTLSHGGDTKVTKRVELALAAASLPNGKRIRLTSVGAQSLAGLLPLGWSPLAAAEIAVDDSSAPMAMPGATLTFHIDAASVAAAAQTLSVAQYDRDRDEWHTIVSAANVASDGKVVVDVPSSGNFALVYPDKAPSLDAPPPARVGAPLRGVANRCLATPEVCRVTGKSFVLDPKAVLPNGRTVATLTVEGLPQSSILNSQFPSGTAVQAFIDEQLNLADGRTLYDPPFATDLLLYRNLNGIDGVAELHLAPSAQAAGVLLRDGVDRIRIVDYPGRIDRGTLIGAEGGRVPGDDVVTIDVPAGATTEPLHASVVSMSSEELGGIGAIAGFRIAGGFTLSLTRANEPPPVEGATIAEPSLLTPAKATVSVASSILNPQSSIPPQVVLAELLPSTPYGAMVRLTALTTAAGTAGDARMFTTRSIDSTQLPLDGIVRDGRYLVLVAEQPIAYAYGQVRGAAVAPATGLAIASARVTAGIGHPQSTPLGVRDLTRAGGLFVIPVAAKPAAAFSLVPRLTSTGDGAAALASASPDPDTFVNFGVLPLAAQPPRLTSVTPADGSEVSVTAPLVVQATFDVALDPSSIANAIRVTNLATGTALDGGVALNGTSTVRFNATTPLNAATRY
ncbi:MAG TPA: Ig-like domain-containing protein, partial [Thermoanaerobaculia bacterium]|nr:Ig-like domain-containing protein [Thermoanaerobaculia bacterium]